MKLFILLLVVSCALALPRPPRYRKAQQLAAARLRRAPASVAHRQRTMLISGYYRPLFAQRRQGFDPEAAMTAFATGDSVAAGSYLGTNTCASCGDSDQEQLAGEEPQLDSGAPLLDEQAPLAEAPAPEYVGEAELQQSPPRAPARVPKRKPIQEESEENDAADEEAVVPTKGRGPSKSYFPIVFSGYPGATRSGGGGGGTGGGVTAIANAYSTGKGGVATSHATAYGSGAPRSRKRGAPQEDDDEE